MHLFNLGLRYKLLLWGGFFIVFTVLAVTVSNLLQTRESLKHNMLNRSEILGRVLAKSLAADLLRDDVWRAYETLRSPVRADARRPGFQLQDLILLDQAKEVFVSSQPKRYPMQVELSTLGADFADLRARLANSRGHAVTVEAEHILLAIPLVGEGVVLGTLILVHPHDYYMPSFLRIVKRTAWTTVLLLLLLLPISWYWGKRMAAPLGLLTQRMEDLADRLPTPMPHRLYPYTDELGRLLRVYDEIVRELADKQSLEQQMVKFDRLSALGRLSAGIAHEINNPLGGMLTAVDTIKRHGQSDPVVAKVVPLLERGLHQIGDIVSALLVEAKAQHRDLTPQDIDDVHTLLAQQAKKQAITWTWDNRLPAPVVLNATLVRQVLLNLLLNAIRAAGQGGHVSTTARLEAGQLRLDVANDGLPIPPNVMEHLFEPFVSRGEENNGLGLWVVYQIVQQLKGTIDVRCQDGWTRFTVNLPTEASA